MLGAILDCFSAIPFLRPTSVQCEKYHQEDECPICLESENCCYLVPCGHAIHEHCFFDWIRSSSPRAHEPSCILCRVIPTHIHWIQFYDKKHLSIKEWFRQRTHMYLENFISTQIDFTIVTMYPTTKYHMLHLPPSHNLKNWKRRIDSFAERLSDKRQITVHMYRVIHFFLNNVYEMSTIDYHKTYDIVPNQSYFLFSQGQTAIDTFI